MNRLTVVPLNFNGLELMKSSMASWLRACDRCPQGASLHLLDNASTDGSLSWLNKNYPRVPVRCMEKNLILQVYNVIMKELETEYVMILNNDVNLTENCLEPLINSLEEEPDALGVTPTVREGEGGTLCRKGGRFFHGHLALEDLGPGPGGTLLLHGAAAVVRRERFLELGGFDSAFFYFEDNDLSYRAWRRGFTCWFEPSSVVEHLPSSTTDKIYQGVVNQRALKEKGNLLFIMKNIHHPKWIFNTFFWTGLKGLKMILTGDRSRWWAFREAWKNRRHVLASRGKHLGLKDQEILDKVQRTLP